jgi:hypothetical protein
MCLLLSLALEAHSFGVASARSLLPVAALVEVLDTRGQAEASAGRGQAEASPRAAPPADSFVLGSVDSDGLPVWAATSSRGPRSRLEPSRDASRLYLDHCALLC